MEDVLKIIADLKKSHQESNKPFNIFTMLLKKDSEAYLHSSFLSWLLDPNPKAPHGLGVLPMRLFLKKIGSHHYSEVDTDTTHITPNAINKTEEGDIDILIENPSEDENHKFAVIIENKIYAVDSNTDTKYGQLQKYFYQISNGVLRRNSEDGSKRKYSYKKENIEVFYLTPDGHEPSLDSTSRADDLRLEISNKVGGRCVKLISYMNDVLPWLKELLNEEKVRQNNYVHEIIAQYMDVVISISCDIERNKALFELVSNFSLNQLNQLKEIIKKYELEKDITKRYERIVKEEQDNAETIDFILNNIKHIYWHSLDNFFIKLQDELHSIFGDDLLPRIDINTGKEKTIDKYVSEIIFEEKNASKLSPMYYRIRLKNGEEWTLQPNRAKGFFLGLDKKQTTNDSEAVGWETEIYLDKEGHLPLLNLWDFTQGDTFDLLNEEKRQEIAEQYAEFVKSELINLTKVGHLVM